MLVCTLRVEKQTPMLGLAEAVYWQGKLGEGEAVDSVPSFIRFSISTKTLPPSPKPSTSYWTRISISLFSRHHYVTDVGQHTGDQQQTTVNIWSVYWHLWMKPFLIHHISVESDSDRVVKENFSKSSRTIHRIHPDRLLIQTGTGNALRYLPVQEPWVDTRVTKMQPMKPLSVKRSGWLGSMWMCLNGVG